MNLLELLPKSDIPAIIDARRSLTFTELDRAAARLAAELRADGLRPGDAVLILHPMAVELYVALLAVLRMGALAMFLDPSAGRAHIERCCRLQPPRALLGSRLALWWRWSSSALRRIPLCKRIAVSALEEGACEPVTENTPALLTFTSGSTGQPKAALRTHGLLLAQQRALADTLRLQAGETDLATLPVFVLANLAAGVTSLIPDADLRRPGAIDSKPIVAQIDRYRPTSTAASPALLARLARHRLTSFRKIFTGGAPVFPNLLDKLHAAAPQADVVAVYGSTEAEPIAHVMLSDMSDADRDAMATGNGLLVGRPVPMIHLRVVRDEWGQPRAEAMSLPAYMPGEIVVSGAHVLPGTPQGHGQGDSDKFDAEGQRWHRTGDAGYLDDRGRLWLLGRCAARIADADGVLYPFAVECAAQPWRTALASHGGQRLLVVEPDAPVDELRQRLAWAQLAAIRVVGAIPMDKRHNAKVDYTALRRLLK